MYRVGKIKLSKEGISLQISEEILEKIKSQNDIVDVISERVRLKKAGRNFTFPESGKELYDGTACLSYQHRHTALGV